MQRQHVAAWDAGHATNVVSRHATHNLHVAACSCKRVTKQRQTIGICFFFPNIIREKIHHTIFLLTTEASLESAHS